MSRTKRSRWKPLLAACVIALLVLPAAASAHMEWADTPTGYYADMPAIALPQQNAQRAEDAARPPVSSAEVRAVKVGGGDNTLPLALSVAALVIALGGAAYMTVRLSPRTARSRRPTAEA